MTSPSSPKGCAASNWGPASADRACGGERLRQEGVTIFDRSAGDPETSVVVVSDGAATTQVLPSRRTGNPSALGVGLVIDFESATCGGPVVQLAFAQRKGRTLLSWRF